MNQYNYIETLENALIPTRDIFFSGDDQWVFQQDNAPCHKAKSVTAWFKANQVNVLSWPARSPDLNPIENVWSWINRKLAKAPVTSAETLKQSLKELFEIQEQMDKKVNANGEMKALGSMLPPAAVDAVNMAKVEIRKLTESLTSNSSKPVNEKWKVS